MTFFLQITVSNDAPFWNITSKYDDHLQGVDKHTIQIRNSHLEYIQSKFPKVCDLLSLSNINKLSILYIKMLDLLHINLMEKRSGSWSIYIYSLQCMLFYFARTGHNNYDRSLDWFLQEVTELRPGIHSEFQRGWFFVRRTSTFDSGVSPELCIEHWRLA